MYVDYPDLSGMAALYSVLFLLAFLWWWFNTDSKHKLLEVFSSLAVIGLIFAVAGGVMVAIDIMRPFTLGESLLIVGAVMSIVAGTGWFMLAPRPKKEAQ